MGKGPLNAYVIFFKIYFWQLVSLVTNFASLFIVMPKVSNNPSQFGVYSICVSLSVFLSYSDLGFLSSAQKYATESVANNDKEGEYENIGFGTFVLLVFSVLFSIFFFIISINPKLILNSNSTSAELYVASKLLLILSLSTPIVLLQRVVQVLFSIRFKDYELLKIIILANISKIIIAVIVMNVTRNIILFYLIVNLINLVLLVITVKRAASIFDFKITYLLSKIKFSKEMFNKNYKLAQTSIFLTIAWIIYYELDSIAISKLMGSHYVAVYAIGLSVMAYARTMLGIIYSPIATKFNHLSKSNDSLIHFVKKVLYFFTPILIIALFAVILFMKPIVIAWLGMKYYSSIIICQVLISTHLFSFLIYPASNLLVSLEMLKKMYMTNLFMIVFYWIFILVFYTKFGLIAFAASKLFIFFILFISYGKFILKYIKFKPTKSFIQNIFYLLFSLFISFCSFYLYVHIISFQKSVPYLILTLFILFLTILISLFVNYKLNNIFKKEVNYLLSQLVY